MIRNDAWTFAHRPWITGSSESNALSRDGGNRVISLNGLSNQNGWGDQPLCSRYFAAFLAEQSVQVCEEEATWRAQLVRWGIGFLDDGECEALGTWLEPRLREMRWDEVLEDLTIRGADKVRFFVCSDPSTVRADACIAYPGTTVLPSIGHLLRQSFAQLAPRDRRAFAEAVGAISLLGTAPAARDALNELAVGPLGATYPAVVERCSTVLEQLAPIHVLSPRLRRALLLGDGIVQNLHQSLDRAVARHGCFADREAAMSFLAEALRRAQRRLDARGMNGAAGARPPVARVGTRSGMQAAAC